MTCGITVSVTLTVCVCLLPAIGCSKTRRLGDPVDGLTPGQRDQFIRGRAEFERVFTPETGLGPLFNAVACAKCHESPVAGGAGDEVEVQVSAFLPAGPVCDPLIQKGGPVIQQLA